MTIKHILTWEIPLINKLYAFGVETNEYKYWGSNVINV